MGMLHSNGGQASTDALAPTAPATGGYAAHHPILAKLAGMDSRPGGFGMGWMWQLAQKLKGQGIFDAPAATPAVTVAPKLPSTGVMPDYNGEARLPHGLAQLLGFGGVAN